MRDFNPITDLQQNTDQFNVPVGQSTPEIEAIREKLVDTRNKTAELVRVVKDKNKLFKKDIDRVKNLNRRLFRTIPRIPAMRGVASAEFGPNLAQEDKKARLRLDFFRGFRTRSKVPAAVKPPLPILETVLTVIAITLGFGGGLKGANKIVPLKQGSKVNTKELQKLLEQALKKKTTTSKPEIPSFIPFKKDPIKFDPKLKTQLNLKLNPITGLRAENIIMRNEITASSNQVLNTVRKVIKKDPSVVNYRKALQVIQTQQISLNSIQKTTKNLDPKTIKLIQKQQRLLQGQYNRYSNKLTKLKIDNRQPYVKEANERVDLFRDSINSKTTKRGQQDALEEAALRLKSNVSKLKEDLKQSETADQIESFLKLKKIDTTSKIKKALKIYEDEVERIERILRTEFKIRVSDPKRGTFFKQDGAFNIDGKPMSNDIASLNIDTGVTNKLIIITDQLPPTTA